MRKRLEQVRREIRKKKQHSNKANQKNNALLSTTTRRVTERNAKKTTQYTKYFTNIQNGYYKNSVREQHLKNWI